MAENNNERLRPSLSLDGFSQPVLICDKDGSIRDTNQAAKPLVGNYTGKHVARFCPALGDLITAFRLKKRSESRKISIRDKGYLVDLQSVGEGLLMVLLLPMTINPALENRLKILETAFNNTSDGIWVADAQARVCAINRTSEHLNGVRARNVIGRSIHEVLSAGLMDRSVTIEVLERKRQASFVQHILPSGKYLQVTGIPQYDQDGEIEFVVVVERDMTDLKHMRSTMEETRLARDKARDMLTEMTLRNETDSEFIAESPSMQRVAEMALKIGRLQAQCILITGESGAGRHSLARYIHRHSIHADGPFMNVSCQAVPPSFQDAELFGHTPGVVPGIPGNKGKAGVFTLAEKGTLMLDDVDELSLQTQAKLLRSLDDGMFTPLGTRSRKKLECCIIVTCRDDLGTLVERGLFRDDLYHRLTMFALHVPPLRERPQDVTALAERFLDRANQTLQMRLRMTPYCESLLRKQSYPGNTHDLQGLIMKAAALSDTGDLGAALQTLLDTTTDAPNSGKILHTLQERLDEVERDALTYARDVCYNTRDMARLLGISQTGVVRKLKKHGLPLPRN